MSICESPICYKDAGLRCPVCKASFYCSKECFSSKYNLHARVCKFSLAEIPLPVVRRPPNTPNFPLQLYTIIDALEHCMRVVPMEKEADAENVMASALLNLKPMAMLSETGNESQRMLQIGVSDSGQRQTPGADVFALLVANGTPASLAVRVSSMGNSLSFCIAIISVIEKLVVEKNYSIVNGLEKLERFYLAKGHVKTLQPRISLHVQSDKGIEVQTQSCAAENDHYVILFEPVSVFAPSAIPGLERAERENAEAMQLDRKLANERKAWQARYFDQATTIRRSFVDLVKKEDARVTKLKDLAVFMAPAASEHDPALHKTRVFKGIPEWFSVEKIFTVPEMQKMELSREVSELAYLRAEQILVELLGEEECARIRSKQRPKKT